MQSSLTVPAANRLRTSYRRSKRPECASRNPALLNAQFSIQCPKTAENHTVENDMFIWLVSKVLQKKSQEEGSKNINLKSGVPWLLEQIGSSIIGPFLYVSMRSSMAPPNSSIPPVTVEFIDTQLPKYHPVYASPPAHYDAMSRKYVPNSEASAPKPSDRSASPPVYTELAPRPEYTSTKPMQLWNAIFPESMETFVSTKTEPKGRRETEYSIRNRSGWRAVYETLQAARHSYHNDEAGAGHWMQRARRKVADNITPAVHAARIATKLAPNEPCTTPVLGAVELLLEAAKTAADVRREVLEGFETLVTDFSEVELYLGTFPGDLNIRRASIDLTVATLDAIERVIGFFLCNAFLKAGKAVLKGVDYESELRESLGSIKMKSDRLLREAHNSNMYKSEMYIQQSLQNEREILDRQHRSTQDHKQLHEGQKMVMKALGTTTDALNSMNELLSVRDRELKATREENTHLRIELERARSTSPSVPDLWSPPQAYPQISPVMAWYLSPEALRRLLDCPDADLSDISLVLGKKEQLPARQRAQAEQVINTPLFRNWIVAPSSGKLLVQWDTSLPKTIAEVSPLSVLCTVMLDALRARVGYVSAIWFCGQHITTSGDQSRYTGGRSMLTSMIDQLLRDYTFDTGSLHRHINLKALQEHSIEELGKLLGCLVRQMLNTTTVFFIVDGVYLYERDQFWDESILAFSILLKLAGDSSILASVKVLFTSTPGTEAVRDAFEQDNLVLTIDGLPPATWAPSKERTMRELQGAGEGPGFC
ncbi:uncharacterized protein MKZ38_006712 [Zalerion maritima]|uniref:Uncharacterized protein n=1 Tax=Zalerion maritima TaxID=339359 RepID=A0AAD5RNF4_9PEZI|nr:uncharacterized protein MKZ38_006712 [Zalerion maritima]